MPAAGLIPRAWLAVPLLFLAAVAVAPAWRLLAEGASAADAAWLGVWTDPFWRGRLLWSLAQAALTVALALALGVPVAWVLARRAFPGRALAMRLLMLPFVVPTLVAAIGVLALWGPRGWPGAWLAEAGLPLDETPWLLLYGNLFFNLCLVVRAGVEALERVDGHRVAAARTLGASPWRAFWRVEWPAIAPWLASAACLVFLYCYAGFGLALVLGGPRWATVEVEIYTLVAHELALGPASALAAWSLAIGAAVALGHALLERRLGAPARWQPVPRTRPAGAAQWLGVGLAMAVLALICGAPLLAIAWRAGAALAGGAAASLAADPQVWLALGNTLRFSALALALATALGLLHALAAHGLARGGSAVRALAYLPFVLSPVTVAFGLLLLAPGWTASLGLLVAAYALLAYPFVAQSLGAALDALPAHWAQAAATLGAPPRRVLVRVVLPLLAPALRRGMAFAAATALGEFAVSLFLSRPEWVTLTTLIHQRLGRPGAASLDEAFALAALLMLLALTAFLLIDGPRRTSSHVSRHAALAASHARPA